MIDQNSPEYDPTTRNNRDAGNVIVQDGKTYTGEPNPNKLSAVKFIYKNEKGKIVCSSIRANGTKLCVSSILNENGRCKYHGGKSLSGIAHPRFKHGRMAKSLPSRLVERYEEALNDETLADFTEDLAVVETRIDDIFKQMDDGGGGAIFTEIKEAFESFNLGNRQNDQQVMRESLRRLDTAIKRGSGETYLWTELRQLQEQRRKIILADAKHKQLTNQFVPVKQVNAIIAALLDSVRRNVSDHLALRDINNDFLRIMGAASGSNGSAPPKRLTS